MASRDSMAQIVPHKRALPEDLIEPMCERYWDAFRSGYCESGGRPEDYPTWREATDPVKAETRRCMRHAVEAFRPAFEAARRGEPHPLRRPGDVSPADWATLFPDKPTGRLIPRIANDEDFVKSQKIARMGE